MQFALLCNVAVDLTMYRLYRYHEPKFNSYLRGRRKESHNVLASFQVMKMKVGTEQNKR